MNKIPASVASGLDKVQLEELGMKQLTSDQFKQIQEDVSYRQLVTQESYNDFKGRVDKQLTEKYAGNLEKMIAEEVVNVKYVSEVYAISTVVRYNQYLKETVGLSFSEMRKRIEEKGTNELSTQTKKNVAEIVS